MRNILRPAVVALALLAGPTAMPAMAVQPDEILADEGLEARARAISAGLRCPVCRNESIDESHAPVARDLRLLVRERLVAGDSDQEVLDYVVARYGEYVLLRPDQSGANIALWLSGPTMLLLGGAIFIVAMHRRRNAPAVEALSDKEKARLEEILKS